METKEIEQNFNDDIDKVVNEEVESGNEELADVNQLELAKKKPKKARSEKQIAHFEKLKVINAERRLKNGTNIKKKQTKVVEEIHTPEDAPDEVQAPCTKKVKKKKPKKVIYQDESSSSDEEVIAVVKRRKKPKKLKSPPRVIYDDELSSEDDKKNIPHVTIPIQSQFVVL